MDQGVNSGEGEKKSEEEARTANRNKYAARLSIRVTGALS